ncbi:MAG: DEAD/DEAH box helicase [Prochlorotrichaceae cyanobacterium]|jgi:SNF2 family DNA or RNA helicase
MSLSESAIKPVNILHGTWVPESTSDFVQSGRFYFWVETSEMRKRSTSRVKSADTTSKEAGKADEQVLLPQKYPRQPNAVTLLSFFTEELGLKSNIAYRSKTEALSSLYLWLPTAEGKPLPSPELNHYLEEASPDTFEWQCWQVDAFEAIQLGVSHHRSNSPSLIKLLNDLHFLHLCKIGDWQLGADLLFWYRYTQALRDLILADAYVPVLKYHSLEGDKPKRATRTSASRSKSLSSLTGIPRSEIYAGWDIVSPQYSVLLETYGNAMPPLCTIGFDSWESPTARSQAAKSQTTRSQTVSRSQMARDRAEAAKSQTTRSQTPQQWEPLSLLRHLSESLVTGLVVNVPFPEVFKRKLTDTLLEDCTTPSGLYTPDRSDNRLKRYQQWQQWYDRLTRSQSDRRFYLYFYLEEPPSPDDPWLVEFQVAPKSDPSMRLALFDYWHTSPDRKAVLENQFGENLEGKAVAELCFAAQIYPKLWPALATDLPMAITLTMDEAWNFLNETAWVLQDAGYRVIVPSWWTPEGQRRAKVKLRASTKRGTTAPSKGYLSFDNLVDYQYELTIGDEPVTEAEWIELVDAKSPLVQFRGQWMQLDQSRMQELMTFWQQKKGSNPNLSLLDLLQLTANTDSGIEVDFDRDNALRQMMHRLSHPSELEPQADPPGLKATLREYQRRGLSWLTYLDTLGLNGCLADDMGLGKTMQVIARLLQEREDTPHLLPTLLVVPTSVIGNWFKELERFAPSLKAVIHHGGDRIRDRKAFRAAIQECDVMITSYTLVRKDLELLELISWHRVVLDEAQNIKNPKAAQTKAVLQLETEHRLALTGTPVENRLMDLWSIFNFLNPGYLGKQAQFRSNFETPIQKNSDRVKAATLKKLVEPFILRRVKTDQAIIKDLPDKVEQKCYCNLTKEQASLYEAVVRDVEKQILLVDGMKRRGLILSTLMKLKQICNHPMQFLQDGSEFIPDRSHKLQRLSEMVEEVMSEKESLLIFTQFTEIGAALQQYLHQVCHYNTYYLHGGTVRSKREKMIEEFQDPETEPSIFILSLKAGGVGITLTKANHVFHFDRWWNPAVEDQATDRAFRIGQIKNVFVHKFLALGTLEERIDQMIEDKKSLAGAIVGSDESWLTELDNESFKKLIALNRSALLE